MKSTLRLAVAAACAAGSLWSGNALAITPSAVPAANILYFSGATATDQQLEDLGRLITGGLCSGGTNNLATTSISIFRSGTQRVTLCPGGGTGLAGSNIGIAKESVGGSENGIQPVAAGDTSLVWLDVKAANFACGGTDNNITTNDLGTFNPALGFDTTATNLAATATLNAARNYTNCSPTAAHVAEAGISDVNASLFGFTGTIDERAVEQVLFGVPVSLNLYRALQIAQGLNTGTCAATPDNQACVPSLTKAQIGALYGGSYVDWTQITGLTTATGVTLPAGGDTSVYVCRRGNTSGSQTFTKAYALAQGCGGSDTFRIADDSGCENAGCVFPAGDGPDFVYANTGSGQVRDCLDARDDANLWAIGVLSTEGTVNDINGSGGDPIDALGTGGAELHTREFRFVGINGFHPSLETAANGGYDMIAENVCTRGPGLPAGLRTNIANRICGDVTASLPAGLSDPALIRAINAGFAGMPHGNGGNLIKADFVSTTPNAGVVTQAAITTNPVNAFTRSASGVINNCSAYQSLGDSPVTGATLRGPNP